MWVLDCERLNFTKFIHMNTTRIIIISMCLLSISACDNRTDNLGDIKKAQQRMVWERLARASAGKVTLDELTLVLEYDGYKHIKITKLRETSILARRLGAGFESELFEVLAPDDRFRLRLYSDSDSDIALLNRAVFLQSLHPIRTYPQLRISTLSQEQYDELKKFARENGPSIEVLLRDLDVKPPAPAPLKCSMPKQ